MEIPQILIYDIATGKSVLREMNKKELDQLEIDKSNSKIVEQEKEKAQALSDSANAKLLALGLSPEEVAAITGA